MRKEVLLLALALVAQLQIVYANNAPVIEELENSIFLCESQNFSFEFNAFDADGDALTFGIIPSGPFFIRQVSSANPMTKIEIFSGILPKNYSNKNYVHTVYVTDGKFSDSRQVTFTVLETNNPPEIEHPGVSTIDLNKSRKFEKIIKAKDLETDSSPSKKLYYNVSDKMNLLEMKIDENGVISYEGSESHLGVHDITVCVTDSGLDNVKEKLGLCTSEDIIQTSCKTFQLAVVKSNSYPTILTYNYSNFTKVAGNQKLFFQIYKYDADKIIPDTYWYVNNKLKQINSGASSDTFYYSFGCEKWGKQSVKAVITDGLANDSIEWFFEVIKVPCPEGILPKETVGDIKCEEKWGCSDWGYCQNAIQSRNFGNLGLNEYSELKQRCDIRGFDEQNCGYQVRSCTDVNSCNSVNKKPLEMIPCNFSLEPSCKDGIQNCHSGTCEILVDCGGPCGPCLSCSDGIQNQGEAGIDCGGPCPKKCEVEVEKIKKENVYIKQLIIFMILFLIIVAAFQIYLIIKNKRKLEEQPKRLGLKLNV